MGIGITSSCVITGTPDTIPFNDTTDPGVFKQVVSVTAPASITRHIVQVKTVCDEGGKVVVKKNGTILAAGRSTPSNVDIILKWDFGLPITSADTVTVEYCHRRSSAAVPIQIFVSHVDE